MNSSNRAADSTFQNGLPAVQPHATPDEEFPQHQEWDGAPVRPADDDLDLLAESGRKVTKVTVVLMVAILAGIAFLGGAVVQKQWGSSTSTNGFRAAAAAAGARQGGFGGAEGGFGGAAGGYGGGFGGGTQGGPGTGAATGSTGSTGSTGTSATPVVVGTVTKVSGRTLTVKNFGGKSVTVKAPKGTTVTNSSASALSGLDKGSSVSVVGTKAADGTVTATSITAH